jgi:hypothetical protein
VPDIFVSDETFEALGALADGGRVAPLVAEAVADLVMKRLLASTLVELAEAGETEAEYPRVIVRDGKPGLEIGKGISFPLHERDPKRVLGLVRQLSYRADATPKFLRDVIGRIASEFEWEIRL